MYSTILYLSTVFFPTCFGIFSAIIHDGTHTQRWKLLPAIMFITQFP